MEQTAEKFACKQPTCKFPVDGKCIEGLPPPNTCPFRTLAGQDNVSDKLQGDQTATAPQPQTYIKVNNGNALNDEGCDALMSSVPTKFIMLAGLKESGKSTLLGSLMQMFQDNYAVAGCLFAGSETLIGFDKICHDGRFNSGREKAHTIRTVKGFDGILHLKIRLPEPEAEKQDLLFSNLSGEDFNQLSNSRDECERFTMAKRADHFVLFLDSNILSDNESRHAVRTSSINVLISLLDAKMINANTKIDVVFSRWDLLLEKENFQKHSEFTQKTKVDIMQRVKAYGFKASFFEIASRPDRAGVLQFGHGLGNLLLHWLRSSSAVAIRPEKCLPAIIPNKEFIKFIAKS